MNDVKATRNGAGAADWLAGAAIYQVYLRSFQDSSGNGVGDLRGVIQRLPHIVALGIEAIWISPFYVSPMDDSGYDVADHCAVDPLYGSLADFDELVEAIHGAGLKLIVDLVFSHTSDRHPWFAESAADRSNAKADWYVWADPKEDGTPPNNWLSAFGGSAWSWNRFREQYYLHDFLPSQPSLDFARAEVRAELLAVARFWRGRGVDGFRLDTMNSYFHDRDLRDNPPAPETASGVPRANPFAQQIHLYDRAQRGDLQPLAEFLAEIEGMGAATIVGRIGDRLKAQKADTSNYTFALPDGGFSAASLAGQINSAAAASADARICWALSNHDTARHVSRFAHSHADGDHVARLCGWLLACLPGAIALYQGEELGLEEGRLTEAQLRDPFGIRFWPDISGRDGCRTPVPWEASASNAGFSTVEPWLPVQERHVARSVDRQAGDPASVLSAYRAAISMRKRTDAIRRGRVLGCRADQDLLILDVGSADERIVGAFNLGATMQDVQVGEGTVLAAAPGVALDGAQLHLDPLGYAIIRPE